MLIAPSADFALGAGIAKTFDEVYNMRFKLFREYDMYSYEGGDALLIAANAQAEANKKLAESLTGSVLEKMYYEKWNGELPYVYGDSNSAIINTPNK